MTVRPTAGRSSCRGFSDSRIRLIQQPNAGPGAARNRGVQETQAPYLAFLDADDEWMPRFIDVYREALRKHPECGAVVGPTFFGSGKTDRCAVWRRMGVEAGVWSLDTAPTWGNLSRIMSLFSTPGTMFRRAVFERYGGFYSKDNCRYSEDKYLWLQVVLNHRVFILCGVSFLVPLGSLTALPTKHVLPARFYTANGERSEWHPSQLPAAIFSCPSEVPL